MNEKRPSPDRAFHAIGMNETPQSEEARLTKLASREVALIVEQLENFAKLDPKIAIKGYKHLLETHQDHPDRDAWEQRIKLLGK